MTDAVKHDLMNDWKFRALVKSMQVAVRMFPQWRIDQALAVAKELNDAEDMTNTAPDVPTKEAIARAIELSNPMKTA